MPQARSNIIGFEISNPIYKKWFERSYTIFDNSDIPERISQCENLFDENVLPIKS